MFYLAQEVPDEPIYISAPEYQVLDNANHPTPCWVLTGTPVCLSVRYNTGQAAKRQTLWGMEHRKNTCIQGNRCPFPERGECAGIPFWTPQWKEMLDNSKFSQDKWPVAYDLLLNCGGEEKAGYIGLQDHGDDVWFRNIKVKILN